MYVEANLSHTAVFPKIAEKLYQQGFLSYPRTETDQFDSQFDFMSLINKQVVDPAWGTFAQSLGQSGFSTPRKGKHDDKAHPPIHPTAHAGVLVGDEKKVYEYITRRFLACCSKDAEGWQTTVEAVCGGEVFATSGNAKCLGSWQTLTTFFRIGCPLKKLSWSISIRQVEWPSAPRVQRRRGVPASGMWTERRTNNQTSPPYWSRSSYFDG